LRDKESNKVADVRVIIAERSPISVVPSTVRFSRGKDGHLIGHAIVARHYLKDESEEARSDSPLITASLLDTSLTVTTSPISRSVIRVTVQIPESIEEGLDEGDSQMVWNVLWGGDRVTCAGKIYLSPTSIVQE
jgi:hypothetical protein